MKFEGDTYVNAQSSTLLANQLTNSFIYLATGKPYQINYSGSQMPYAGLSWNGSQTAMSSGWQNHFGLKYQSVRVVQSSNAPAVQHDITPGGAYANPLPYDWAEYFQSVTNPSLTTVDYYFAQSADPASDEAVTLTPMPNDGIFALTNTTPLMLAAVGQPTAIYGWAKQQISNGDSTKFAYLGQYFEKAYKTDGSGNATGTQTGILSEYGDFFASEPGKVILKTKADPDQGGSQGPCPVYAFSMNVDANHDGTMDLTYSGPDTTSDTTPMKFWVNNDNDGTGVGQDGKVFGNNPAPDYTYGQIRSQRNLEDFARLWICGVPSLPASQGYTVTLSCSNAIGSPTINLYLAESGGGIGYLTNSTSAQNLISSPQNNYDAGIISPTSSYTFPGGFFDGSKKYFVFEGARIGSGQFSLAISQNGNVIAQSSVWIELHDVKDFFEQNVIQDSMSGAKSNWTSYVEMVQPAISSALGDDQNLIVLVHGINVRPWDCINDAGTVFKRLYWAGFQGKFAEVQWPCNLLTPLPSPFTPAVFNDSELQGYKASTALTTCLNGLKNRFPNYRLNILAHSQGNAVVSEAIKRGFTSFDTYILTQGALPASAYDVNATNDPDLLGLSPSPELQPMGYRGIYTNSNFAGRIVNFYNPNDPVLDWWVTDQIALKPSVYFSGTTYFYDGTNSYYDPIFSPKYLVTDPEESRAEVSRSRSLPIGQSGPASAHGVIKSAVDLHASYGFDRAFPDDHSAQWTRPIQTTSGYYLQTLDSIKP
jgi:predicted esterase